MAHVTDPPPVLSDSARRMVDWRLGLALLALVSFVALILLAYFSLPADRLSADTVWQALLLAVLALGVLLLMYGRSVRRIAGARRPVVRLLVTLTVFFVVFLVLFSYAYLSLEARQPGQIPGLNTHLDGLYFTVTMLTTVGFGDIVPAGQLARGVVTMQMVFNLVFLGVLVRTAVHVGRKELDRRRLSDGTHPGGD